MDAIYKLNNLQFNVVEGVLPEVTEKAKAKKLMASIIGQNEFVGARISDEGDMEEQQSKISIAKAYAVILYVDEEYFKVIEAGKTSEEEEEEQLFHLVDTVEIKGWIIGKSSKKINGVRVDSDELIAIRKADASEVPLNADNYIEANLTWIFDRLLEDFEEKYGEGDDEEEIDDGD